MLTQLHDIKWAAIIILRRERTAVISLVELRELLVQVALLQTHRRELGNGGQDRF